MVEVTGVASVAAPTGLPSSKRTRISFCVMKGLAISSKHIGKVDINRPPYYGLIDYIGEINLDEITISTSNLDLK